MRLFEGGGGLPIGRADIAAGTTARASCGVSSVYLGPHLRVNLNVLGCNRVVSAC